MINEGCIVFLDKLASKDPVPGGGGASAFAGCLGVALTMMVGNLTIGKKKYADVENAVIELMDKCLLLEKDFQNLVIKDAEAFLPLSKAYSMPKNTEEEARIKDIVMQKALIDAALVPLEIAEKTVEALEVAKEMSRIGSRIVISDAGVAAAMFKAALLGAKLNVLINIKIMNASSIKTEMIKRLDSALESGLKISEEIYNYVEGAL